ncbi:hypothetical protein D3OALGA1CA_4366 [Olavius algarvensis associated proteobacterium Delta 3]|nr:hypothetical protein D3OALGB2SA_178 [Olavius algarvensis associated proteobacterium Delta 3]CAB5149967.1 hypothetical protein D3OALGA1CA_4366 [Olavius algarvensis associated proteobacterium Delta 3]
MRARLNNAPRAALDPRFTICEANPDVFFLQPAGVPKEILI